MIVIPGNHDSRNVGYVHFEELFGQRRVRAARGRRLDRRGRLLRARPRPRADRPQPLRLIEERFSRTPAFLRIFVLHHHLLPIPGTGRERNIVYDAGDLLECLLRADVNLVLSGHKHVPYAWRLEDLFVVNAGTVSTLRLRGKTRPCYNVIEVGARAGHACSASTRSTTATRSSPSTRGRTSTRRTSRCSARRRMDEDAAAGVAASLWEGLPDDLVELTAERGAREAVGAHLAEVVTDDFVCVMDGGEGAFRAEYPGAGGLMDAWGDWLEPWESYRLEVEDVIEARGWC